jgi:hypothetical protein
MIFSWLVLVFTFSIVATPHAAGFPPGPAAAAWGRCQQNAQRAGRLGGVTADSAGPTSEAVLETRV